MGFLPLPQLVHRVAELARRFQLEADFGMRSTNVVARALWHARYPATVQEREARVMVFDPVGGGLDMEYSGAFSALCVNDTVFDLDGNIGWDRILENMAARRWHEELDRFPRTPLVNQSLSVLAHFSTPPETATCDLVDRAKGAMWKFHKALEVRSPRLRHEVAPPRLPAWSAATLDEDTARERDLDGLGVPLQAAFASRDRPLSLARVAHEVAATSPLHRGLRRPIRYSSNGLFLQGHRMALEYGTPLRRVCVDESGAWEGLAPHEQALDPEFDASRVQLGPIVPFAVQPAALDTSAALGPLQAQLAQARLHQDTPLPSKGSWRRRF